MEMDVNLKAKKMKKKRWKRKKRQRAAADLGWRGRWWSLNPPQDQRNPGLRGTSLRWLQSRGRPRLTNTEIAIERERKKEQKRAADMLDGLVSTGADAVSQ